MKARALLLLALTGCASVPPYCPNVPSGPRTLVQVCSVMPKCLNHCEAIITVTDAGGSAPVTQTVAPANTSTRTRSTPVP